MKPRTILTVVILAFVAVAVGFLVVKKVRTARAPDGPASDAAARPGEADAPRETEVIGSPGQVVVYYFYFGKRCATCLKIEKYTKEALEGGFAKELEEGAVVWRPIDTDLPENRHFNDDYELFAKAVVVSYVRDGEEVRWKNLMKVWQLTGDKGLFVKYIQGEVRAYLSGN